MVIENKPTIPVSNSSTWQPRLQGEGMSAVFGRAALLGVITVMSAAVAGQGQAPAQPPAQPPPTKAQAATPTPESRQRAEQVMAEARKALGGEKLASVKTLVAAGRTRRIRGNNLVPIEFELFLELPDKYLRADEFPAEDTDPTSSGFNGED